MELRSLRYFLRVAEEGNITSAAYKLHVTQPTLSRQIRELEQELGCALFIRRSHSVDLTPEGALLQQRASEIVGLEAKTREEFDALGGGFVGDVYFGAAETHNMDLIARIFAKALIAHPTLKLHLSSGNADDLSRRIDRGTLDFGIVSQPANTTKYESLDLPVEDTWVFIARKNHPLASKESVTPQDLVGEPLIVSHQAMRKNVADNDFARWFGDLFDQMNVVADFNLPYNGSVLARAGVGSVITFDGIINTTETSDLRAIPLNPPVTSRLAVIWRKRSALSEAASLFLRFMQADMKQ